ncbi:MAG: DciA family protein [Propionibacteriaceae bacterium]|nr:DciA family protein [Propionibacteriaceae bacterium]
MSEDAGVPPPEDEAGADPAADADPIAFDPTGLDLARQIAEAAGRTSVPPPRRQQRTPRASGRRTGSRRDRAEPMALGDALEKVISARGWGTEVNVHLLLGRWAELVGPAVAEHSTPEAFKAGVVVVRTSSTNWASQLRLMAPQLVARMNASLGDGTIRMVKVLGPEAPSWTHGPRTVKGRGPRDTYG